MARRRKRSAKAAKEVQLPAVKAAAPIREPVIIEHAPQAPGQPTLIPLQVPAFSAGTLVVQATGNDFVLTFMRAMPLIGPQGLDITKAMNQPVAVLMVSPATAKDMSLVLAESVAKQEKRYGKILTPYMERQAAGGKKAKSKKAKGRK